MPTQTVRVLYCGANPVNKRHNHLDLGKEFKAIQAALRNTSYAVWPEYAVSPSELIDLLVTYEPQIVHFGLHGASGRVGIAQGRDIPKDVAGAALLFTKSDGAATTVSADALRDVFAACSGHTKCVVLNACSSASVAQTLSGCVDHVIGMQASIPDDAAIAFSHQFYASLAHGKTYRVAFEQACGRLRAEGHFDSASPVLVQREGAEKDAPQLNALKALQPPPGAAAPPSPHVYRLAVFVVLPLILIIIAAAVALRTLQLPRLERTSARPESSHSSDASRSRGPTNAVETQESSANAARKPDALLDAAPAIAAPVEAAATRTTAGDTSRAGARATPTQPVGSRVRTQDVRIEQRSSGDRSPNINTQGDVSIHFGTDAKGAQP